MAETAILPPIDCCATCRFYVPTGTDIRSLPFGECRALPPEHEPNNDHQTYATDGPCALFDRTIVK